MNMKAKILISASGCAGVFADGNAYVSFGYTGVSADRNADFC